MARCLSCGDPFDANSRRLRLKNDGIEPHADEFKHCRECADEKFRGVIRTSRAKLFSSGRGCPLEDGRRADGDTSPWGENNVRILEGD